MWIWYIQYHPKDNGKPMKIPKVSQWVWWCSARKLWSGTNETPRVGREPRNGVLHDLKTRTVWYMYITEAATVKG